MPPKRPNINHDHDPSTKQQKPDESSSSESPSPPRREQPLEPLNLDQIWERMRQGIFSPEEPQPEQLKRVLRMANRLYIHEPGRVTRQSVAPVDLRPPGDWLQPSGNLLRGVPPDPRYWGQDDNEVVLVLPPSSMMFALGTRSNPIECYVTVQELIRAIGDLHRPVDARPAAARVPQQLADPFNDHQFFPDIDVQPVHEVIMDLYLRFLRNCGIALYDDDDDYNLWTSRSSVRREGANQHHFNEEYLFQNQLRVTFHDIESFVRQPPETRNLQTFINQNRNSWLNRQQSVDTFRQYWEYRDDIFFPQRDEVDVRDDRQGSDPESDPEDPNHMDDHDRWGGKRRKPATKRKARRSASSKRKPAVSKRHTTKKSSRRRRRSTTRRH
jgi:hypothetical protein